jgi:hypothetical protein
MVYAIVRTESGFDQRDMSSAKAVGLIASSALSILLPERD